jgi:hypothetical protein
MNKRNTLKLISGLPLVGFFIGSGTWGCASKASSSAQPIGSFTWGMPTFAVGERWNYNLIDGFNGEAVAQPSYTVTEIGSQTSFTVTKLEQNRTGIDRFTADGAVMAEVTFDSPMTYEAGQPLLVAGKTVQTNTRFKVPGDTRWLGWNQSLQVLRYEQVKVPAGQFDTVVLQRRINFTHPDHFRNGSSRVDTLWYSPKARLWVKRDWRGAFIDPGDVEPGRMITSAQREIWRRWELTSMDAQPLAK